MLHDAAKYFKPQLLLQMAQKEGLELDSVLEAHPHLLHADASAIVARDEFGIVDREIDDLLAAGISQGDIVLGFHNPSKRAFTEVALL